MAGGSERMQMVLDAGALCRLDANRALGPAAASRAMALAAERAGVHGIALVAVGRSTHFGRAGYYVRQAAARGLIGIAITNAPATMAPFSASERFLGTNPIAIACPLGHHGVFALDMSSSVVARGKIIRAALLGESIPEGLAIDPDGSPTRDAEAALAGSVLPPGGPKGSNLALAITMLCGVLAGSDFDDEMASMYEDPHRPQNVGHVFIAIDPAKLADPADSTPRLEGLVDRLHRLRRARGADEILFAGELEERRALGGRSSGVSLPQAELAAFAERCAEYGLDSLAGRARSLLGSAGQERGGQE
jgi:LDH2 family malate/lactate/ureidoglycolate dehydrogenase